MDALMETVEAEVFVGRMVRLVGIPVGHCHRRHFHDAGPHVIGVAAAGTGMNDGVGINGARGGDSGS